MTKLIAIARSSTLGMGIFYMVVAAIDYKMGHGVAFLNGAIGLLNLYVHFLIPNENH